ncbi:MAG: hypothetical protein ACFCVE_14100 [Phycisphaerae bacterium]
MTRLLEQALERLRSLPQDRQDAVARLMLAEIDAAAAWDARLNNPDPALDQLARQVLDRAAQGQVTDKGWDEL